MTTSAKRISPCPPGFSDHIYKVEHGVEVPLRIWPGVLSSDEKPAPWLLWIHGGGLQAGKHFVPNSWVYNAFSERGYHIVSTAYRFIPEVWLKDIMQDCLDALSWCRMNLPHIIGHHNIDLDSYVVAGDSVGGTLSTLFGHLATPRPKAIIDIYGVVDLIDPKLETPPSPGPYLREWTTAQLEHAISFESLSEAVVTCPWDWELPPNMSIEDLRTFWGTDYEVTEEDYLRMDGFKYIEKLGKRMIFWIGGRECTTPQEIQKRAKQWSSYWLLDQLSDHGYPPTFILHGNKDTVVPIEQAYMFAKKLREKGFAVEEAYCPEGGHCFDQKIETPGDAGWKEYIVPCMDFVDKHVNGI